MRRDELEHQNTRGVAGWCLEIHDLAASKLAAGRPKDFEFLEAMVCHDLLWSKVMEQRIADLPPDAGEKSDLLARWERILMRAEKKAG